MSEHRFVCPCGQSLTCNDSLLGKEIACPTCGTMLQLGEKTDSEKKDINVDNCDIYKYKGVSFSYNGCNYESQSAAILPQKIVLRQPKDQPKTKKSSYNKREIIIIVSLIISLLTPIIVGIFLRSKWTIVWIMIFILLVGSLFYTSKK